MKCVCPMGGDRVCPDDCPLAVWASLSKTDRKAQRKPITERLYKQGFSIEQIATQLGVGKSTVARDIAEFSHDGKTQPRASKRGRKNEGRPKGSGRKGVTQPRNKTVVDAGREALAREVLDHGKTVKQAAVDAGVSEQIVKTSIAEEKGRREPKVERTDLSLTAQEKLDVAIRQYRRKLDAEFEVRTREECRRWLNEVSLPQYVKELTQLERAISNRKGIMDRITYKKILTCLHPDRQPDPALKKRYEEAFQLFTELEKRVLDEKESPTEFRKMPRTYEELMAMKAKVQAERRAKRASKTSGVSVR